MDKVMTKEEIHDFGIEVVSGYMKDEGFLVKQINTNTLAIPSIIAEKDGKPCAVLVRNDVYPDKGDMSDSDRALMLNYSEENKVLPMLARVGIANANGTTNEEMGIAVRGAGFYISFEGLEIIQ